MCEDIHTILRATNLQAGPGFLPELQQITTDYRDHSLKEIVDSVGKLYGIISQVRSFPSQIPAETPPPKPCFPQALPLNLQEFPKLELAT